MNMFAIVFGSVDHVVVGKIKFSFQLGFNLYLQIVLILMWMLMLISSFGYNCTFMGLSLITSMEMCSDPANA